MRQTITASTTHTKGALAALRLLLAAVLALSGLFLASPAWADESGGIEPPASDIESSASDIEPLAGHTITLALLTPFIDTLEPTVEVKGGFFGMLVAEDVPIDVIAFPDENFRNWLLDSNNINGVGADTVLTPAEIAGVTDINVSNKGITDLTGTQYFTALTSLDCSYNKLTSLDVSNNPALEYLDCGDNNRISGNSSFDFFLTSLNVNNNPALEYLDCGGNELTSLDVNNNPALKYLDCSGSRPSTLDISNNSALEYLDCGDHGFGFGFGGPFTSLDVSNNPALKYLNCSGGRLTALDINNNPALEYLDCSANHQITFLDVSNNPALEYLDCSSAASYYTTSLTFLNVNNNPAMKHLDCFGNNLTTLDVSASPMLEYLDCSKNRLTFLDVSNNPALKYLDCNSGGVGVWLAALNVSNNPALEYLDCSGHYTLVSLDISKNPALEYLNCGNGRLAALDVSNNPALVTLRCFYSSLTSLNVSNSPALEYLDCSANYQITSLDVSNNPALEYLDCNNGRLTSLDVSTSPALEYLDCSNNYLSSLNANTRPALVTLDCYNNQLATLDVSGDSALVTLNCYNNRFLDVSGLPDTLQYFSGLSQAVTVSVHANSASPGSYLSNAIYDFGTHTITLNSTDADFGSPNGLFITTVLDTPVNFVTDAGAGHRISGTVTFAATSPSSDKDITSFTLAGVAGTIERTSINVTVPHGTDVTSLVPVIAHTGANISPAGAQDFTSPVTYTVTAEDATTKSYTVTVTVLAEPVAQHGGKDRYDTAVKASQKAYPDPSKVDAVVLAYSYNFPDALAASYLAGALDAPILLSDTSDIDDTTVAEIKRLSPSIIYIVGGTGAISANIENALEAYDFTPSVVRLGGAGREETAYEIANAAKEMRGVPSVAFIADAANFPDALSAGSLSAGQGVPILLTATGSLDEWTQRFLEENDISDIIIVGGPGSVSETVATQLRALSHNPAVTRWSGSDRYATSADVLTKAIAKWNLTPAIIGLASGEGFPDALVGGAAVGNRGGLLAITDPDTLSAAAEGVISTYKDGISDVEIFGGTGTIRVADKVQGLLA